MFFVFLVIMLWILNIISLGNLLIIDVFYMTSYIRKISVPSMSRPY